MINFLGLMCLSILIAEKAEPVQVIKSWFNLHNEASYKNIIQWFFVKLLNCSMCLSWWIGLAFYQSILICSILCICTHILNLCIDKITYK